MLECILGGMTASIGVIEISTGAVLAGVFGIGFMVLAGSSFALHYKALSDPRAYLRSAEFKLYLAILGVASVTAAWVAVNIDPVLGILLARSITRPIKALTGATQAVAQGEWA